jgi:hypothetical protein
MLVGFRSTPSQRTFVLRSIVALNQGNTMANSQNMTDASFYSEGRLLRYADNRSSEFTEHDVAVH